LIGSLRNLDLTVTGLKLVLVDNAEIAKEVSNNIIFIFHHSVYILKVGPTCESLTCTRGNIGNLDKKQRTLRKCRGERPFNVKTYYMEKEVMSGNSEHSNSRWWGHCLRATHVCSGLSVLRCH
jgi:uncharacterized secreted protein with C-terminal beta-propeller domain